MIITENEVSQTFCPPRMGQTLLGAFSYSISILLHNSETQHWWDNTQRANVLSVFGGRYVIFTVHVCLQCRAGGKRLVKEPCYAEFGDRIKGIRTTRKLIRYSEF